MLKNGIFIVLGCIGFTLCGCTRNVDTSWKQLLTTTKQERQGDALFEQGQYEDAVKVYREALQEGAAPASVAYRIGQVHLARKQYDMALESFRQAVESDEHLVKAYIGMGNSALELGRYKDAASAFRKATTLSPQDWSIWVTLSGIQLTLKQMDEAKEARKHAIKITADSAIVDQAIRKLYSKLSQASQQINADTQNPEEQKSSQEKSVSAQRPLEEEEQHDRSSIELDAFIKRQQAALAHNQHTVLEHPVENDQVKERLEKSIQMDSDIPQQQEDERESELTEGREPSTEAGQDILSLLHDPTVNTNAKQKSVQYVVLESSYSDEQTAKKRAHALEQMGLSVKTDAMIMGKRGIWYRVLLGSYASLEAAKQVQDELEKKNGLHDLVILKVDE